MKLKLAITNMLGWSGCPGAGCTHMHKHLVHCSQCGTGRVTEQSQRCLKYPVPSPADYASGWIYPKRGVYIQAGEMSPCLGVRGMSGRAVSGAGSKIYGPSGPQWAPDCRPLGA